MSEVRTGDPAGNDGHWCGIPRHTAIWECPECHALWDVSVPEEGGASARKLAKSREL